MEVRPGLGTLRTCPFLLNRGVPSIMIITMIIIIIIIIIILIIRIIIVLKNAFYT